MSGIDIASNSALLSVAEKLDTQNIFLAAIAGKDGGLPIKDWGTVQALVRAGLAPKIFAIGDQLVCNHEIYGELVWDVIGIDHDTPSDSQFKHSITLQLHDCCENFQFDAPEAMYYCTNELPAGTYYFTIQNYDAAYGGNTSYYFTLTNTVPAGGQIDFRWGHNVKASECKISTYKSPASLDCIETVNVNEGTEGNFLGVTDGTYENMNHAQRLRYGSNNWKQSAVKQWLNSADDENLWWNSAGRFDRAPSYIDKPGFLNGIDADFLSVLGKINKRTALNNVTDGGKYEDSTELMFFISYSEAYSGLENAVKEGEPYPYYKDYSKLLDAGIGADDNRIKYFSGLAKYWWLRSPNAGNAYSVRGVGTNGDVYSCEARYVSAIAPACCVV